MINFNQFEIVSLVEFNLIKRVNHHTSLEFKAIINDKERESYLSKVDSKLEVSYDSDSIFAGYIYEVAISFLKHSTLLNVKAFSYSKKSDIQKHSKVFQDTKQKIKDIIAKLEMDNVVCEILDSSLKDKILKEPIVQYRETDFQFIQRLLFDEGVVLVVDDISNSSQKLFLGKREYLEHKLKKNQEYTVTKSSEQESIKLDIKYPQNYSVGDYIKSNSDKYWIISSISTLKNQILHTHVEAIKEDILTYPRSSIYPVTLRAKIVNNSDDEKKGRVQVEFVDIDDIFSQNRHWFSIDTPLTATGRGFFFIPSKGDMILVTFHNEHIQSISTTLRLDGSDYYKNPQEIFLVYSEEMMLKMGDENIEIKNSGSTIQIKKDEINIKTKKSNIDMTEDISIKGSKIKLN